MGSVTFTATTVTYQNLGTAGTDTFKYIVSDGKGGTDQTKVVVKIVAPP
ncbi:MAG: Ig-like domain-containing protein [Gammaproteobacteria bacterium]